MTDNDFFEEDILDDYMYDFNEEAYKKAWSEYGIEEFKKIKGEHFKEEIESFNKIKNTIEKIADEEKNFIFIPPIQGITADKIDSNTLIKAVQSNASYDNIEDIKRIEKEIKKLNEKLMDLGPDYKDSNYYKECEVNILNMENKLDENFREYNNIEELIKVKDNMDKLIFDILPKDEHGHLIKDNDNKAICNRVIFNGKNVVLIEYNNGTNITTLSYEKFIPSIFFNVIGSISTNGNNSAYLKTDKNGFGLSIADIVLSYCRNYDEKIFYVEDIIFYLNKIQIETLARRNRESLIRTFYRIGDIEMINYFLVNEYFKDIYEGMANEFAKLASYSGNAELIEFYSNINYDNIDIPTLIEACKGRNPKIVEYYLNNRYFNDNELIQLFGEIFDPMVAKIVLDELIKRGCDVNTADELGRTPLHYAAMKGNAIVAKLLIDGFGANINARDKCFCNERLKNNFKAKTPLHYAIENKQFKIVELLLSKPEIDINAQDVNYAKASHKHFFKDKTPLHYAIETRDSRIIKLLLSRPEIDVNIQSCNLISHERNYTPLHYAVAKDDKKTVELLLENKFIDLNLKDSFGYTAISYCISRKNIDIFNILCNFANADILKTKNNAGETLLHEIIRHENFAIFECLLNKMREKLNSDEIKEIINAKTKYGSTPFEFAISMVHDPKVFELLLNQDEIEINTDIEYIKNTLFKIVAKENSEIFKLVFEKLTVSLNQEQIRDVINAKNEDGKTFINYAIEKREKNAGLFEFLIEKNLVDINTKTTSSLFSHYPIVFRTGSNYPKKENFYKIEDIKYKNKTLLHCAANAADVGMVQKLLEQNEIDINAEDNLGKTPLSIILEKFYSRRDITAKDREKIKSITGVSLEEIDRFEIMNNWLLFRGEEEIVENEKITEIVKLLLQRDEIKIKNEEINEINTRFADNNEIMELLKNYREKQIVNANNGENFEEESNKNCCIIF